MRTAAAPPKADPNWLPVLQRAVLRKVTVPVLDEASHTYRTADGKPLVGATELMKALGFIGDTSFYTDEARDRGRRVHKACHFDSEGDLDARAFKRQNPGEWPYVAAWRRFRTETGYRPVLSEQAVCSPLYGVAGTLDSFGMGPGGADDWWLIDLKSGAAPWWVRYQLAIYALCLPFRPKRFALELKPNGTYKLQPMKRPWAHDPVVTAAAKVYWAIKTKGER